MTTTTPYLPTPSAPQLTPPMVEPQKPHSPELAAELNRLETEARVEEDRRKQDELARLRELARFD